MSRLNPTQAELDSMIGHPTTVRIDDVTLTGTITDYQVADGEAQMIILTDAPNAQQILMRYRLDNKGQR